MRYYEPEKTGGVFFRLVVEGGEIHHDESGNI